MRVCEGGVDGGIAPVLSRALVLSEPYQTRDDLDVPDIGLFRLPEKAVQFGTGAFIRGFVDFLLDEANRAGTFGGRVVVVGSTGSGRVAALKKQDGLFTLTTQGFVDGRVIRKHRVISTVSRALSARNEWNRVLEVAASSEIGLVFSNTTEVGIVLDEHDGPDLQPPRSYPGKLTKFLLKRAQTFDFDLGKGPTVVPCELVEDNGDRLREVVLTLADRWRLDVRFTAWVEQAVWFANTLVDRIVPGVPAVTALTELRQELGYQDELLTVAEPYRLFALQGGHELRCCLGFAAGDASVVVSEDIRPYRERKLRLLNGTHTLMAPTGLLCGLDTVGDAVENALMGRFVRRVLFEELLPVVGVPNAETFAGEVLTRLANPFVRHGLLDITLEGVTKLRVRVIPALTRYVQERKSLPNSVVFGLAGFFLFMRGDLVDRAEGLSIPADRHANRFRVAWRTSWKNSVSVGALVRDILSDTVLWGSNLSQIPDLTEAVEADLVRMLQVGTPQALEAHLMAVGAA